MDRDAAFRELGVERDVTPEQAHRRYVRLVKQRKPGDDLSGFQRLCEAYEAVRATLASDAGLTPSMTGSAPTPAQANDVARACAAAAAIESGAEWRSVDKALQLTTAQPDMLPPLQVAIETSLVLLATGAIEDAVALQHSLAGYLSVVGETRVLQGELATRASVARDLAALAGALPRDVAAAIADGFVRGTHDESVRAARLFVRARPDLAPAARQVSLALTSPAGKLLRPHLASKPLARRPQPAVPAAAPARGFLMLRSVVVAILVLVGLWVLHWW